MSATVDECAARWGLRVGDPLDGGNVSLVRRVWRDSLPAVLEVSFPEPESEHEAAALSAWAGFGAVSLLEHDPEARALLAEHTGLERERMRGWGIAHALAWGHGREGWDAAMVQCAEPLDRA